MLSDSSCFAGGKPAEPLGREQVAVTLASIRNGSALHTVGGLDDMASESDHITHDESELLQAQSLAARGLDDDLAAGLRHRQLGGETSSADYLRDLSDRPRGGNRCRQRDRPRDRAQIGEAHADRDRPARK